MNLLLDTHVALWAITDSPRLSSEARDIIQAERTVVWVSAASIWEIAIKRALSRVRMPVSSADAMRYFRASGYRVLDIAGEHAAAVESLPPHHQDPFDRILIAQAMVEPMRLMTHDAQVARYSDTVIKI